MSHNTKGDMWYADSDASKHMTNDPRDLFDMVSLDEEIVVGNDERLTCKVKGKLIIKIQINEKENVQILLNEVLYVPKLKSNLFSLSVVTKKKGININIEGDKVKIG